MPDFTQGQWNCDFEGSKYIFGSNQEIIGELFFINEKETNANARLIAAAPDMYELLDMAAQSLRHHSDNDGLIAYRIVQLLARIDGEEVNNNA